jgi:hypothetical protein
MPIFSATLIEAWFSGSIAQIKRDKPSCSKPGMGACQLRSGEGQTRHMYLVFLAYTALMRHLQHDRAQEWAQARLTTIGESCRAMFRETLGKTIAWVVEQVTQGQSLSQIKAHLALP